MGSFLFVAEVPDVAAAFSLTPRYGVEVWPRGKRYPADVVRNSITTEQENKAILIRLPTPRLFETKNFKLKWAYSGVAVIRDPGIDYHLITDGSCFLNLPFRAAYALCTSYTPGRWHALHTHCTAYL